MNLKGNDQESDTETMFLSNIAQQSKNIFQQKQISPCLVVVITTYLILLGLPQLKGSRCT